MEYSDYFNGKKITLMGLGLLGRGVGDAEFLARCGAKITITDTKSAKELASSVARLKKYPNIKFALGGHRLNDFKKCDFVLKAAGVPLDSPFVKAARKNGIPVHMSTALFVKLLPPDVTVIGITGTRGKTTTSFMIYEIIKRFKIYDLRFKNKKRKPSVYLGGNIQGVSTLALLPKVRAGDFVVLELDSWQLQGFGTLRISPHIAVFTNFLPDHLNYYGTMERYFRDKANIFKYQKPDTNTRMRANDANKKFIVGEQAVPFVKKWEPKHAERATVARRSDVPKNWKLKIPGEHNRQNIACAVAVAEVLGVPRAVTKKAVENFRGVPGRLELVREMRGVKVYNDTTATTPDATIAALRALSQNNAEQTRNVRWKRHSNILQNVRMSGKLSGREGKNIVLIMGGADKGLDMSVLAREIPKYCKAVILLSGTGSKKFSIFNFQFSAKFQILNSKSITHHSLRYIAVKNLKEAFANALKAAIPGDIILFSPAFASFGMFKNEYDRGEKFNHLVRRLKSSNS